MLLLLEVPATTMGLTFWKWVRASSSMLSVALTISGGVSASHWLSETSWNVSVLNTSRYRRVVSPMFST